MHIFITRLKCLLRSKENIFWTFFFPCILGLFFHFGFGNLNSDSIIETTDVYIASENANVEFIPIMEEVKINHEKKLFNVITKYTKNELENLLEEEEIVCFVYVAENTIYLRLENNGINQTIIKSFLDQYIQTTSLIVTVQTQDPAKLQNVIKDLQNNKSYLEEMKSFNNPNATPWTIYFYALIAMACMFASYWGLGIARDIQANMSHLAARVNITPTHKFKLIFIYLLVAQLLHFAGNIVLIMFLKYVLNVQFTNNTWLIILASFIGTFSGISFGICLSVIINVPENFKKGITTVVSLLLSALSGLMSVELKYYVDKYLPPLKYINPAALLTDAFNSLYYFNSQAKYFSNLLALFILSLIFTFLSYLFMRGKKYDNV